MDYDLRSTSNNGLTYVEKAYVPNISQLIIIAEHLKDFVFESFSVPPRLIVLINDPTSDCPQTSSDYTTIYTSCIYNHWAQFAYQLSHELCHFMIGRSVVDNLCWFEESISEAASWFFVNKLADKWENVGLLGVPDYASSLRQYIDNCMSMPAPSIMPTDLADPASEISLLLASNQYLRDYNRVISKAVYPIFCEHPDFWSAVPLLAEVPAGKPLFDSFNDWALLCDSRHAAAFEALYSIFIAPDSSN